MRLKTNVMESIQNSGNQNQQAKNFQMRYNLSKFNNQIYQTLNAIQQGVSNSSDHSDTDTTSWIILFVMKLYIQHCK